MFDMSVYVLPKMFVWTILPYGCTRAPFLARDLMKPLIDKWHDLHIDIVVFCDNGMAVSENITHMKKVLLQVQCNLLRTGWYLV